MKIWAVLIWLGAFLWASDAVRILYGYQPDKTSMFIAFLITAVVTAKWGFENWRGE